MMSTRAIGLGATLRKATMNPSLSELSRRVYLNLFTLLFIKLSETTNWLYAIPSADGKTPLFGRT